MDGRPIQLMAFGYRPHTGAEDRILAELDQFEGKGVLRLLDFLFVHKTPEGELVRHQLEEEDHGAVLTGVLNTGQEGVSLEPGMRPLEEVLSWVAADVEPGSAMALVLIEHVWANALFSAVKAHGGELVSEGFITGDGSAVGPVDSEHESVHLWHLARHPEHPLWEERALEEAEMLEAEAEIHGLEAFDGLHATERLIAQVEGIAALSPAERLLLRQLCSSSSFAILADRLGVSRGALKERASQLYSKLGVHSRAEAVEEARRLGLTGR